MLLTGLKFNIELPIFLSLTNRSLFECWKVCLCYILSFRIDAVCVSLGSIRVFSSAVKLLSSLCWYYKHKLIGGASVANVAELFVANSLVSVAKAAHLEWLTCFSICSNSILIAKLGLEVLNLVALCLFNYSFWPSLIACERERISVAITSKRYFKTVFAIRL
ncbi:MAG: hypothetical protein AAI978_00355 [Candidatus Hodgkinia cicadicola]